MAGIPGSHANSLAPIVPQSDLATSVTPQLGAMPQMQDVPPMPMAGDGVPQGIARPSLDELYAQAHRPSLDELWKQSQEDPEGEAAKDESQQSALSPSTWGEGIARMGERAKASFANSPEALQKYLTDKYGEGNVKPVKNGENFLVKDDGKWRKFKPDGYTNDIPGMIAGQAKNAVSELAALPAEAAGTAAAIGSGGLAAAPAMAAGRVAGGMTGEAASQGLGAAMGIDQGSAGSMAGHMAAQGAMRAVFGAAADKLSSIAGNWAEGRMAKKLAQKSAQIMAPTPGQDATLAAGATKQIMQDTKELADAGYVHGLAEGEGALLTPADANTAVPELVQSGKKASETQEYRNFMTKRGEVLAQGWQKVKNAATDMTDGIAARIAGNATEAGETAMMADRAWGTTIGKFRDEFRDQAGNGQVPVAKYQQAVKDSLTKMGYTFEKNGDVAFVPEDDKIAYALQISKEQAKQISDNSFELFNKLRSGRNGFMAADELEQNVRQLMGQTNASFKSQGSPYELRQYFMGLKNAARDDFTDGLGLLTGEQNKAAYQKALANFSTIKTAAEDLDGLFKNDQTTNAAMGNYLFGNGLASLDRVNAMKKILAIESPEAWDSIKAGWLKTLTDKHTLQGDGGQMLGQVNWRALQKELLNKPEVVEATFGEADAATMQKFLRVAGQVQDSLGAQGVFKAKDYAGLAHAASTAAELSKMNPLAAITLFRKIGSEKAMEQNLTRGGREEILKRVSAGNRGYVANMLDKVSDSFADRGTWKGLAANQAVNQAARTAGNALASQPQQPQPPPQQ